MDALVVKITPVQSICSTRLQDGISSPELHSTVFHKLHSLPWDPATFRISFHLKYVHLIILASVTVLDRISLYGFLPNSTT